MIVRVEQLRISKEKKDTEGKKYISQADEIVAVNPDTSEVLGEISFASRHFAKIGKEYNSQMTITKKGKFYRIQCPCCKTYK